MSYEKLTSSSSEAQSESPVADHVTALAALFPSVVREGKVDFDALRQILGDDVEKDDEVFGLQWKGKAQARRAAATPSLGTLRPCKEESVDWDTTKNLYIEGDNLEVLKLLRKSYADKVKMIYIDPPYNTGKEFVYPDNYQNGIEEYKKLTGQQGRFKANVETSGRYHTDWLNMMYPRLMLARDLLKKDGVIFISIGDEEVGNLRKICDEVFGEYCFVTTIHCQMSTTQGMKVKAAQNGNIVKNSEYILCYSKGGKKNIANHPLYDLRPEYDNHYSLYLNKDGSISNIVDFYDYRFPKDLSNKNPLKLAESYNKSEEFSNVVRSNLANIVRSHLADIVFSDQISKELRNGYWKKVEKGGREYLLTKDNKGTICQLLRLKDSWGKTDGFYEQEGLRKIRGDWWEGFYIDMGNVSKEGGVNFKNGKKPVRLIKQLIYMTTEQDDIVFDFFSGSSTTAHAVMQLNVEDSGNRKFLMIQLPEECNDSDYKTVCEIGKERIRRAGKKIKEEAGLQGQHLDIGFRVYKLDSSNLRVWNPEANDLELALGSHEKHLLPGRTQEDLLYEILLKQGIELTEDARIMEWGGKRVYSLGHGQYYACMEPVISSDQIEPLALGIAQWKQEESPDNTQCAVFVIDEAFRSDADKLNFAKILEQHGIPFVKAL